MTLEVFKPSMCCESGVCGHEPDKELIELQNNIQL
ncbi:MAG: arsenic metallochaperone ArsD family protein [Bacteroidales bacterium]|nr:arsenic metallochaperone ArsD family protein [Bacteroidales bacterium]